MLYTHRCAHTSYVLSLYKNITNFTEVRTVIFTNKTAAIFLYNKNYIQKHIACTESNTDLYGLSRHLFTEKIFKVSRFLKYSLNKFMGCSLNINIP